MKRKYSYEKLTWHEVNEAVTEDKVALIPVGTIEDHGPHLPLDTDVLIATSVAEETAKLIPDELVVLPTVAFGYSPHHIDFPGPITIPTPRLSHDWDVLVRYMHNVAASLAHHGFRKILMLNAHGSNRPCLDLAARLTIVDYPGVQCGYLSWWELEDVQKTFDEVLDSPLTAHACEIETSVYLAVQPEMVYMDKAEADTSYNFSPHVWSNMRVKKPGPEFKNPIHMTDYWSMDTSNGVWGDPTVATAEKGKAILTAAARELAEVIVELRQRKIGRRVPHQVRLADD